MSEPTDWAVLLAMETFGGSFVSTLAQLARFADPENFRRIKATWPEYWAEYAELARIRAANGQGPA